MQWSKLKKRVEENFAESIKGRIEIFTTSYRRQGEVARSWVVIDSKQGISLTDYESWSEQGAYFHELTPTDCLKHKSVDGLERTVGSLYEAGEFSSYDFKIICFESLSLSAHDCIKSEHPLLRVIGVLHRKLGKAKVNEMLKDPHPMVIYFADFRIKAEAADLSQKFKAISG
ncbi:SF0329 family protein [Shewanella algae]|uniref:SF0329 family protein n=1 Tax=Shewanella algae TaxID=38313 RepID=UPI0031F4F663